MAFETKKVVFRFLLTSLLFLIAFYLGRPLYWKISASVHDIRDRLHNALQSFFEVLTQVWRYYSGEQNGMDSATFRRFIAFPMLIDE